MLGGTSWAGVRARARLAVPVGGLALLAAAAAVVVGTATHQAAPPVPQHVTVLRHAVAAARTAGAAPATRTTSAAPATRTTSAAPATRTVHLLVVGASYTQGLGAAHPSDGYAYQLGRELGWTTEVDGVAGTGFVNPGPRHQGTFAQRLARVHPAAPPDVVLLQGGRNDVAAPVPVLTRAVEQTLDICHERFAGARLALLGPIPGRLPVDPAQRRVAAVLRSVASAQHVLFIDPLSEGWISPANVRGFSGSVPGHPNDAGYAFIADRVGADLLRWWETRPA